MRGLKQLLNEAFDFDALEKRQADNKKVLDKNETKFKKFLKSVDVTEDGGWFGLGYNGKNIVKGLSVVRKNALLDYDVIYWAMTKGNSGLGSQSKEFKNKVISLLGNDNLNDTWNYFIKNIK